LLHTNLSSLYDGTNDVDYAVNAPWLFIGLREET
jgi:hypothetical protein